MSKTRIFSGVQPSGNLHIGNYLGAISQWVALQDKYDCIFSVVDYHAITVPQKPAELKKKIIEIAKLYIAAGIDPEKSVIFQQSDVKEHTELAWVLNTITKNGDLTKMTQFKDKSGVQMDLEKLSHYVVDLPENYDNASDYLLDYLKSKFEYYIKKHKKEDDAMMLGMFNATMDTAHHVFKNSIKHFNKVGVGLFDYPVLMAADILLYDTEVVPVGDDQLQHVELARDLAKRFNHQFGETLRVPKAEIRKEGARIMGLDNPDKKMSKSAASANNYIALTDEPAVAKKKIMKAVADSGTEVKFNPKEKPGISNLLVINSLLAGKEVKSLEKEYKGVMYGDFKKAVAEAVAEFLTQFQEKYNIIKDSEVREILDSGAKKIRPIAAETIARVKERIGVK